MWYRLTQWVVGLFGRVYFRLQTEGRANAPMHGPTVLVCNHESHLDPLLVGVYCPRIICYFARDTLFKGLFGALIRSYDAIPVDQEKSALAGLRVTLGRVKMGDAVLVFPEGTRSYDGRMQPIKGGFITLVRRGKAALLPVGIDGPFEAMPIGKSGVTPRKIAIVYGQSIPFEELAEKTDQELMHLVEQGIVQCRNRAMELTGRTEPPVAVDQSQPTVEDANPQPGGA